MTRLSASPADTAVRLGLAHNGIHWCDLTRAVSYGCERVSPACDGCWAVRTRREVVSVRPELLTAITDDDARRLLSMEECIEAMRLAYRDFADGRAISLPRVRYKMEVAPGLEYFSNVHVGAVPSLGMACVRAGSHTTIEDPKRPGNRGYAAPVNWTVIILYDLKTSEPVAFLHESYVSGFRVGATFAYADSKFDGNGDDVGNSRDRKSTRLNSSHVSESRMPSSA